MTPIGAQPRPISGALLRISYPVGRAYRRQTAPRKLRQHVCA